MRRAGGLVLLVLLAACGNPKPNGLLPGATPQPPASRTPLQAPPGLVRPGSLTVAADYNFAPQSYVDPGGKPAGFDIDLMGAAASQLKLKLKVVNIDDPSIIQGLTEQKRRYDLGLNQPHGAAVAAGVVSLGYFSSGQALLVRGTDRHVKGLDTICGLKVWASPGSEGELAVAAVNDRACHDRKAKVTAAKDDVDAAQQLADGRIEALVDDYPAAVLLAKTGKDLKVVPRHTPAAIDLVFPPGGEPVRDAIARALDRLVKDGTYRRLLDKWGLAEGALLK